jgi:WS/DGAT/MGAT family acyltransferase
MAQGSLVRRLSAQDAAFLYSEKDEAPMHIGSIALFEGRVPYERFVQNMEAKLHLIPRYTQVVVPAPFNVGHPTWEWDQQFDIRRHVLRAEVEAPGTEAQLFDLASTLFAGPLDRDKPLWEIYLVDGLQGDRSALVSKVHHCLVDGVSGIELLMIMLDVSQDPPPPIPAPEEDRPPAAGPLTRFLDAVFDNLSDSINRFADSQSRALDAIAGGNRARAALRALETALPYAQVPVARAPFNKPFKGGRKLACSEFSFTEIRGIRAALGGTVNDVVLAVLGGALGRYFEMHAQTTEGRSARVLTPVNVRREDERSALGNRVSMLLVEVPVGVQDPVERLHLVSQRTDALKRRQVADGIESLGEGVNAIPPALQALLGALPAPPNTLANMVCTNVPGPMIPLYCVGQRLSAHYPLIPIAWEMGVGCGVTSYDQKLYFGLMADADAAPDVQRLKEFLDQAYIELRAAAGVARSDLPELGLQAQPAPRRRRAASTQQSLAADAG